MAARRRVCWPAECLARPSAPCGRRQFKRALDRIGMPMTSEELDDLTEAYRVPNAMPVVEISYHAPWPQRRHTAPARAPAFPHGCRPAFVMRWLCMRMRKSPGSTRARRISTHAEQMLPQRAAGAAKKSLKHPRRIALRRTGETADFHKKCSNITRGACVGGFQGSGHQDRPNLLIMDPSRTNLNDIWSTLLLIGPKSSKSWPLLADVWRHPHGN